jgi:hypothetical protein
MLLFIFSPPTPCCLEASTDLLQNNSILATVFVPIINKYVGDTGIYLA